MGWLLPLAVPSLMAEYPLRLDPTPQQDSGMSNNLFTFVMIAVALAALAYFAYSLVSPFR